MNGQIPDDSLRTSGVSRPNAVDEKSGKLPTDTAPEQPGQIGKPPEADRTDGAASFLQRNVPTVGLRTIKTAVAVALSYLVFLPLNLLFPMPFGEALWGGLYACVAAVICMQGSVGQSLKQGISRLIGTAIGGIAGLLILTTGSLLSHPAFMALMLVAGTVAAIWMCNLIKRPAACAISVVVLCVILFNHTGQDRYLYALSRMIETSVGVFIAIVVNLLLPDHRKLEEELD